MRCAIGMLLRLLAPLFRAEHLGAVVSGREGCAVGTAGRLFYQIKEGEDGSTYENNPTKWAGTALPRRRRPTGAASIVAGERRRSVRHERSGRMLKRCSNNRERKRRRDTCARN